MMTTPRLLDNAGALVKIHGHGPGVLLLHGFPGTPYEMKYLGKRLHGKGYSISIPRLPGHGTSLEEIVNTGFRDWHLAAREALIELAASCDPVYLAGISMGGLLAIHLAAEFPVRKIALMSVPRTFKNKSIYLAPLVGLFKKILWKDDTVKGLLDEKARARHVCYDRGIPIRQAWQVFRAARWAMGLLPRVTADALVMQSNLDDVIPADSLEYIHSRLGSPNKRMVYLEKSGHTITVDREKAHVADLVIEFFSE